MVKIIKKENKTTYQCEECKLRYKDNKWAKKCEKWCHENQSCNLEIIEHAIK